MEKKSRWPRVRQVINDVHLWLGLASGLVVIAVCFSGTIYVWNTELTEWAQPHLYKANQPATGTAIPPDQLLAKFEKNTGKTAIAIQIPAAANRTWQFSVPRQGGGRGVINYAVNPYSGEVTGSSDEPSGMKDFLRTMFSLHRWLLLDKVGYRETGSIITGCATILFTLGCITGLIIWFPPRLKAWKQGLKIYWRGNWKRINHDLHNTLAFYSLIFLLLMGITGPFFSFDWYRNALRGCLGVNASTGGREGSRPGREEAEQQTKKTGTITVAFSALSLAECLAIADHELNYKGDYALNLPKPGDKTISIRKRHTGFFASPASDVLTLELATGAVKKKELFHNKPFNERVAGSIKALHLGNVYGGFTKWIYFMACLIATTLPVTGTLIWLNKLKKKKKQG